MNNTFFESFYSGNDENVQIIESPRVISDAVKYSKVQCDHSLN